MRIICWQDGQWDKGSGTLMTRLYKETSKSWDTYKECSFSQVWQALKLHSLNRFSWFKKPVLLIQAFPFTSCRFWKDLGRLNILELALTLALKSTMFTQLTEVWIELYKIILEIQIFPCKKYFPWALWI